MMFYFWEMFITRCISPRLTLT